VPPGQEQPLLLARGRLRGCPQDHLEGLWAAAAAAAAAGAPGSSVALERRRAPSLAALCADAGAGGAVVVAAGAAAQALPELQQLPLRLSAARRYTSAPRLPELRIPEPTTRPQPPLLRAPCRRGRLRSRAPCIAPDGAGGVALGATKARGGGLRAATPRASLDA
jgi:hypothetical protein